MMAAGVFGLLFFASCGGGADTPEAIAAKWCELNKKAHEGDEKAREEMKKLENDVEAKHEKDKDFMKKVEEEVEKCEDESEGHGEGEHDDD